MFHNLIGIRFCLAGQLQASVSGSSPVIYSNFSEQIHLQPVRLLTL